MGYNPGNLLSNAGSEALPPRQVTPQAWLDRWCSNTNGAIVARLSGTWSYLLLDTDAALTENSDTRVASQKAVKSYVAAYIAAQDVEIFKGGIDCSGNPDYPAADAGHVYRVSVAGKIGGASGVNVEVNDRLECVVDSSASGNHATVGANWMISQVNIDGAVTGPASATSANLATFSGTSGKIIQDSGKAFDTDGTFSANSDNKVPTQKAVKTYVDNVTGADIAPDIELTLGQLAISAADSANGALFLGAGANRFADSFDALTYVDVAGATNLNSGTAGLLKPTVSLSLGSIIGSGTGTIIGNFAARQSAVFDGSTSQANSAAGSRGPSVTDGYVGKNYSGSPKRIYQAKAYAPNNTGFNGSGAAATVTLTLYGKATAPSSGTDGTSLGSTTSSTVADVVTIASSDQTTEWPYVWINITGSASTVVAAAEFEFYETTVTTNNVSVSSSSLTAVSEPGNAYLVARVNEVDSIALNTDLIFSVSRDGGTTWTAFTMTDYFTRGGLHMLGSNTVDISGQPSGTSMRWKAETANGKMVEIHDVYLRWF